MSRPCLPRALLAAALLAGCTVGPNYRAPDVATPSAFIEAQAPRAAEVDLTRWWTQFKDPELESLVARALSGNLDLLEAASRIRQARQQEVVQAAAGLPQVTATGNFARIHAGRNPLSALSAGAAGAGGGAAAGGAAGAAAGAQRQQGIDTENYAAGFDATWELDVFGGVRRGVEAARASTAAAVWQRRDGQVSLTAEVANDYLMLRALQLRIAIAQDELKTQRDTGQIVRARAVNGFVTRLDVNQQDTQIAQTAAGLPQLQSQARAQIHALGVLTGQTPEALADELAPQRPLPGAPALPAAGLPSDLLRRRPDVRRAERQLAAATAQIGVQTANLYPKFNLLALVTFANPTPKRLFEERSLTEAGLGLIQWPIFTAGRTRANIRSTREQANQSYFEYRKAVLQALQDTEDALARYDADRRRLVSLNEELAAAQRSLVISREQYVAGLVIFTTVLQSESAVLNARDQAAQGQAQLSQDLVSLYKALGGGWDEADAAAIADRGGAPY